MTKEERQATHRFIDRVGADYLRSLMVLPNESVPILVEAIAYQFKLSGFVVIDGQWQTIQTEP